MAGKLPSYLINSSYWRKMRTWMDMGLRDLTCLYLGKASSSTSVQTRSSKPWVNPKKHATNIRAKVRNLSSDQINKLFQKKCPKWCSELTEPVHPSLWSNTQRSRSCHPGSAGDHTERTNLRCFTTALKAFKLSEVERLPGCLWKHDKSSKHKQSQTSYMQKNESNIDTNILHILHIQMQAFTCTIR